MKIQHGNYVRLENEMNTVNIGSDWVLNKMCFLNKYIAAFLIFYEETIIIMQSENS